MVVEAEEAEMVEEERWKSLTLIGKAEGFPEFGEVGHSMEVVESMH